jgi:hypothetical protein
LTWVGKGKEKLSESGDFLSWIFDDHVTSLNTYSCPRPAKISFLQRNLTIVLGSISVTKASLRHRRYPSLVLGRQEQSSPSCETAQPKQQNIHSPNPSSRSPSTLTSVPNHCIPCERSPEPYHVLQRHFHKSPIASNNHGTTQRHLSLRPRRFKRTSHHHS